MSECVWVSDALRDSDLVYHFTPSETYFDDNLQQATSARYKYLKAEPLTEEEKRTSTAFLERIVNPIDPLPDFMTSDFALVSERVRDLLTQFELGTTAFQPVTLYGIQKKIRYEPDYYYLFITEVKKAIQWKQSTNLTPRGRGRYHFTCVDGAIAVSNAALEGVDLWMEPNLGSAVFFSNRLYQELKSSGLVENVKFAKCTLVD